MPLELEGPRPGRDPWLDNARLVAIVGVVLGHCLLPVMAHSDFGRNVWVATFAFRVPVAVVVAGWFASSRPLTRSRLWTLASTVLLAFVIFQALGALTRLWLTGDAQVEPWVPGYAMWFLLALFLWRAALPLLARVRHVWLWSIGAALGAGFIPAIGPELALGRAVAWFPLFLLGHRLSRPDVRARLAKSRPFALGLCIAGAASAVCVLTFEQVGRRSMSMDHAYSGSLTEQMGLLAARGALLLAGAAGAVAVLLLVSRRRIPVITWLGTGSLSIYLLHSLVVPPLSHAGAFTRIDTPVEVIVMLIVAALFAGLLASRPVRRLTRGFVRPDTVLDALAAQVRRRASRPAGVV